MNVTLKCVYERAEEWDGCRILVDRSWPVGLSKDHVNADLWFKDIAPSQTLAEWFGSDPGKWLEFQEWYIGELHTKQASMQEVVDRSYHNTVTLLTVKNEFTYSYVRILRDYMLFHYDV